MTKETKINLRGMKQDELKSSLVSLEENIRVLRFKAEGSKSKNVKEGAHLKKQIAQILTKLNQIKASAK